ncbi:putative DNA-directed RNA polymerase II subunit 1 [Iris pallida]|uniref:DNA-directed RNA polymerase II subunit 1 n=1 Tax=Iris pallida TaxID=29817 RepID=A0AAX6FW63_IRIPA|nr:putative DNA-directed RNA polymerase II subunit 1 [Iris pallida]
MTQMSQVSGADPTGMFGDTLEYLRQSLEPDFVPLDVPTDHPIGIVRQRHAHPRTTKSHARSADDAEGPSHPYASTSDPYTGPSHPYAGTSDPMQAPHILTLVSQILMQAPHVLMLIPRIVMRGHPRVIMEHPRVMRARRMALLMPLIGIITRRRRGIHCLVQAILIQVANFIRPHQCYLHKWRSHRRSLRKEEEG